MRTLTLSRALGLASVLALAGCTDAAENAAFQASTQEPIVGGQADSTSRDVIGILTREGELCSGSLILPNLVLTARHCVANLSSGESVQCGVSTFGAVHPASDFAVSWDDNLRDNVPDNSVYYVSKVQVPTDSGVCGNDIALLELSSNVPADQATPLEPRLDSLPMNNEVFDAVGYGLTNPNDQSGATAGKRMRFDGAHVSCVGNACRNLGAAANEWAGDVPVCSGDSGGPALDSAGRVIGAASRGPQQCNMAIYSGVSPWKDFIVGAATKAASDGGYTPPGWVTGTTTPDAGMPTDGGVPVGSGGTPGSAGTSTSGGATNNGGMHAGGRGGMTGAAGSVANGGATNSGGMHSFGGGMHSFGGGGASSGGAHSGASGGGGTGPVDAGAPPPVGGMPATDAGMPPHAGAAGMKNGAAGSSSSSGAGAPGSAPAPDPGCGCRTVPEAPARGGAWWPLLVAAWATTLRRRLTRSDRFTSRRQSPS